MENEFIKDGLWVPCEIVENPDLTLFEKFLFAQIDHFTNVKEGKFCCVSNEWFAKKFNRSENVVAISISHLKELGFVKQVSFDGRKRVFKKCSCQCL